MGIGIGGPWVVACLEVVAGPRNNQKRTPHIDDREVLTLTKLRCCPTTALVLKHQLNQLRDNPVQNRTRDWKSSVLAQVFTQ